MAKRKVYVTKKATFEAAHHLKNYDGKCSQIHGHSYKLEVTFSGFINPTDISDKSPATEAMVCDFNHLKKIIGEVVGKFDHNDLNYYFEQPTAECMVIDIYHTLERLIGVSDFNVHSVKLWETEDSFAEYKGEVENE